MSNYATKYDLKGATGIDISDFAKNTDLANLKSDVDKLDIDDLITVPVELSKLSDVVKNGIVKKSVCDKLLARVNTIPTNDTSDLVKETDYDAKSKDIEDKYITTSDFNKFSKSIFEAKLATNKDLNIIEQRTTKNEL